MSGNFKFDKFMKDIVKREKLKKSERPAEEYVETDQRRHRKLYSERWQNRIKWSPRRKNNGK